MSLVEDKDMVSVAEQKKVGRRETQNGLMLLLWENSYRNEMEEKPMGTPHIVRTHTERQLENG